MKVVLLSLDAAFDQDLPLLREQPFFGEFLAHARGCLHVRTVFPALTYPAHTTLITGTDQMCIRDSLSQGWEPCCQWRRPRLLIHNVCSPSRRKHPRLVRFSIFPL